jgi:hypothetical protein
MAYFLVWQNGMGWLNKPIRMDNINRGGLFIRQLNVLKAFPDFHFLW